MRAHVTRRLAQPTLLCSANYFIGVHDKNSRRQNTNKSILFDVHHIASPWGEFSFDGMFGYALLAATIKRRRLFCARAQE